MLKSSTLTKTTNADGQHSLEASLHDTTMAQNLAYTANIFCSDVQQDATICENEVPLSASNVSRSHSNTQQHTQQDGANAVQMTSTQSSPQ